MTCFAQNPSILWQQAFGGTGTDVLTRFDSPTGGYYFIGQSDSDISGDKTENSRGGTDIWVVKTDANYAIEWDKTIGGDQNDVVQSSVILNDTIYIMTHSSSNISGEKTIAPFGLSDLWLVALNLNGDILWQEQYGGSMDDTKGRIIPLFNGNFLVSSLSNSGISGNKTEAQIGMRDLWIFEINPQNGAIIQQKTIGSVEEESFNDVIQLSSGDILVKAGALEGISGDKSDFGYGNEDMWLVKLDGNLNVLSDKCFGGDYSDGQTGNVFEDDGFLYATCSSNSEISGNKTAPNQGSIDAFARPDCWILKLDLDFNIIWDKTFGGTIDDYGVSMERFEWNKIVLSGVSNSTISGNKTSPKYGDFDTWILILNLDGDVVAQETYGGANVDNGFAENEIDGTKLFLSTFSDSGISGIKTVPSNGGYDCWFMELDASDFLNTEEIINSGVKISVYPNPVTDNVNIKFTDLNEDVQVRFYNSAGQLLSEYEIYKNQLVSTFKLPAHQGIIIYEVKGKTINYRGKLTQL